MNTHAHTHHTHRMNPCCQNARFRTNRIRAVKNPGDALGQGSNRCVAAVIGTKGNLGKLVVTVLGQVTKRNDPNCNDTKRNDTKKKYKLYLNAYKIYSDSCAKKL